MFLHKIYGSDKDLLSLVFFGTNEHNTTNDFLNIFVLQVMRISITEIQGQSWDSARLDKQLQKWAFTVSC